MALKEKTIPDDRITVLADSSLEVREATVLLRHGVIDPAYRPKYHGYVLHPGADLSGIAPRIAAVATALWTPEVIAAWRAAAAEE